MKKFLVFLSLLSMLSTAVTIGFGQGRTRRVGDSTDIQQTSPPAPAPGKPPVLGGANYPNNRQPAPETDSTPTGPEEVDAGDVIRVSTTLVTIPVSVMDRDGRYIPNLQKEEFRIWEDGVEQDVAFFQSVDKPYSLSTLMSSLNETTMTLSSRRSWLTKLIAASWMSSSRN